MSRDHVPRFVRQFAQLGDAIIQAGEQFASDVRTGAFPGTEHAYEANGSREADALDTGDRPNRPLPATELPRS